MAFLLPSATTLLHPHNPGRTGAPIKTLEKANSYQSPFRAYSSITSCHVRVFASGSLVLR